jgi:hypothetical protein
LHGFSRRTPIPRAKQPDALLRLVAETAGPRGAALH